MGVLWLWAAWRVRTEVSGLLSVLWTSMPGAAVDETYVWSFWPAISCLPVRTIWKFFPFNSLLVYPIS